jgi:hypothetical protein
VIEPLVTGGILTAGVLLIVHGTMLVGILLVLPPLITGAQTESSRGTLVDLPQAAVTRIPSPDGKWTLIFECPNDCGSRKLSIEDNTSHTRRPVGEYDRNLSIAWAPDSRLFFVNDARASDQAFCYVYDPITLRTIDVAMLLASRAANAVQFLNAGHSYLKAERWVNSHVLVVNLYGHFDEPPARGFALQYRIDLNGSVHKLSQIAHEGPE